MKTGWEQGGYRRLAPEKAYTSLTLRVGILAYASGLYARLHIGLVSSFVGRRIIKRAAEELTVHQT